MKRITLPCLVCLVALSQLAFAPFGVVGGAPAAGGAPIAIVDGPTVDNTLNGCGDVGTECNMASQTITGGNKLVVVCAAEDNAAIDIDAITWNTSESLSQACQSADPSGLNEVEIWYLDNPTATTATLSIEATENLQDVVCVWATYSSVSSGAPSDTDTDSSASSNTWTATVTAAASSIVFIGATKNGNNGTYSGTGTETEILDTTFSTTTPSCSAGASYELGQASPSITSTGGADRWGGCAAVWTHQ